MGQSDQKHLPEYQVIDEALHHAKVGISAAEAHGLLCGMLSAGSETEGPAWMSPILGDVEESDVYVRECKQILKHVVSATEKQLTSFDFDFIILLPADDEPMEKRLEALSEWCQGFLAGFGITGIKLEEIKNEEISEALQDIANISQVDVLEVEDEDAESHYAEVLEFVKVAVLLICTECRQRQVPSNTTVH